MKVLITIDDRTYEYDWSLNDVIEFVHTHDGESFEIQVFSSGDDR